MAKEPIQPQDKYVLRMPDGMRARLKEMAAQNKRSLNQEILDRLELSFNFSEELQSLAEAMAGFAERVDVLDTISVEELEAVRDDLAATEVLSLIARLGFVPEDILDALRELFLESAGPAGNRRDMLEAIARKMYNKRELHRRYTSIQELITALDERLTSAQAAPK